MTALPVASHTMLQNFDNCPYKGFRMYIAKDVKRVYTTDKQGQGIDLHKAMSMRITRGRPLPPEFQKYEPLAAPFAVLKPAPLTEMPLAIKRDGKPCGFFDDGVFVRGYGDVVVMRDDTAALFDWKDAKKREDPAELRLHGLMLQASYPNIRRITAHYVWMRNVDLKLPALGKAYDVSDTRNTWSALEQQMDEIEHMLLQNHFPKQPNPLCGWCDVLDCEHNKNEDAKRAKAAHHG